MLLLMQELMLSNFKCLIQKYISKDSFYASYMKKGLLSKSEKINEFFKRLEVTQWELIQIKNYCKKKV